MAISCEIFEIGEVVRTCVEARLSSLACTDSAMTALKPLNVPVWYVNGISKYHSPELSRLLFQCPEFKPLIGCLYRCVAYSAEKLVRVILFGIDVFPLHETFYVCESPAKCNEYGGDLRMLMCLDPLCLVEAGCSLQIGATEEDRAKILAEYPYSYKASDGTEYFSRIRDESHRFTGYEREYGKWIRNDTQLALKGIVIIDDHCGSMADKDECAKRLNALLSGSIESDQMPFERLRMCDREASLDGGSK